MIQRPSDIRLPRPWASGRAYRLALVPFLGATLALFGCDALTAAKGSVDTTKTTLDSAKTSTDQTKQQVADEKKKAKDGKDAGGGAAGGEKKEDDDDTRIKARQTDLDTPVNDELNVAKGDMVDWKRYDLTKVKAHNWVIFELNWDEPSTEIDLDVYDQIGAQVVQSPGRSGVPAKVIPLRVDTPGVYYARIKAVGPKDASVYTVVLRSRRGGALRKPTGGAAPPAPAAPAAAPPGAVPPAAVPPGTAPPGAVPPGTAPPVAAPPGYPPPGPPGTVPPGYPPAAPGYPPPGPQVAPVAPVAAGPVVVAIPEGATVGKIVQSFRGDDGKTTLYLNFKGSASKLRVGMNGTILDGPDGGKALEGGQFQIVKVIGDGQAVATSNYDKSLGKNNRFMVTKQR